jgi:hypothetical protein
LEAGAACLPTCHRKDTSSRMVSRTKANVRLRKDRSRHVASVDGGREIDGLVDADANAGDGIKRCPV